MGCDRRVPCSGVGVRVAVAIRAELETPLLAGLGARVIKIENPESPDPCRQNPPYLGRHGISLGRTEHDHVSVSALNRLRGKYGVTLNLKQPGARDVFADLVCQADIVVENFSAGTLDRLGVGYLFARSINPRVIDCWISGFGASRPSGTGKAMDSIMTRCLRSAASHIEACHPLKVSARISCDMLRRCPRAASVVTAIRSRPTKADESCALSLRHHRLSRRRPPTRRHPVEATFSTARR